MMVVACALVGRQKVIQTFGTTSPDLLAMGDWLASLGVSHVAMESSGSYWKPVYNLLEGRFELLVVNAAHIKAIPGKKTDVADAEWIAELLRHGLLRASFIPGREQRDLRELTRHRTALVEKRAQAVNELQKHLESANIKLAGVATDITGVSATAMLKELLDKERIDPAQVAQLARRRLRAKIPELEKALQGELRPHLKLIIGQLLADIDLHERQIAELDGAILDRTRGDQGHIDRLDEVPGINRRVGEIVVAEIGTRLERFPHDKHLAKWVGLCPGNNQTGGKPKSGRTTKGNRALRAALVEAAQGAARTKKSYFRAQYLRIAARRGKKKALIAVAHSLIRVIYHILKSGKRYVDLGADYFDRRNPLRAVNRLAKRIANLGYSVQITPAPVQA
jgi:transposase